MKFRVALCASLVVWLVGCAGDPAGHAPEQALVVQPTEPAVRGPLRTGADGPQTVHLHVAPAFGSPVEGTVPGNWHLTALRREREWVLVRPEGELWSGWVYAPLPVAAVNVSPRPRSAAYQPRPTPATVSVSPAQSPAVATVAARAEQPLRPQAGPQPSSTSLPRPPDVAAPEKSAALANSAAPPIPEVVAPPAAIRPQPVAPDTTPARTAAPEPTTGRAVETGAPEQLRKNASQLPDAKIVSMLIAASRARYYQTNRPCACPEDRARNGSLCGARSAHSRPGGASPLCYPSDVTPGMIAAYRQTGSTVIAGR